MKTIFQTDWLGSHTVFYNELTGKISHNINDVIDFGNLEFHPEGFNNYLDFGYSVFQQTPIKHVKFLRHSSRISRTENRKLNIEEFQDPAENWFGRISNENNVVDLIAERIQEREESAEGEIIIPTSGGYDSRLLNLMVKRKERIRSFSYGLSNKQYDSYEVVYARKVSEILNIRWEWIPLGDFHQYLNEWLELYGVSTHAHGMYHFEFYKKIMPKITGNNLFLTGIFGDAWAGNVSVENIKIEEPKDLKNLSYSHGLHADSNQSLFKSSNELAANHFENMRDKLRDDYWKIIELVRLKIILISYLLRVPEYFNFKPYSPYLETDIALGMLTLPFERRVDRLWQKNFFRKRGLGVESMNLRANFKNTLNFQAMRRVPLKPLDVNLLKEVVKPDYIEWINSHLEPPKIIFCDFLQNLQGVTKIGGVMYRLGIMEHLKKNKKQREEQPNKAYWAYLTLIPIEDAIRKRNDFLKSPMV